MVSPRTCSRSWPTVVVAIIVLLTNRGQDVPTTNAPRMKPPGASQRESEPGAEPAAAHPDKLAASLAADFWVATTARRPLRTTCRSATQLDRVAGCIGTAPVGVRSRRNIGRRSALVQSRAGRRPRGRGPCCSVGRRAGEARCSAISTPGIGRNPVGGRGATTCACVSRGAAADMPSRKRAAGSASGRESSGCSIGIVLKAVPVNPGPAHVGAFRAAVCGVALWRAVTHSRCSRDTHPMSGGDRCRQVQSGRTSLMASRAGGALDGRRAA